MPPAPKHRDNLVYAAMTLFRRQGYAATGLAEILSASGAPKGSLYHYFPEGKEAIGEAALHRATEEMGAALFAAIAGLRGPALVAPALSGLLRTIGARMAAQLSESGYCDGCPVATIALEATPQLPRLSQAARGALDLWSRSLAHALTAGGIAPARAAELGDFIISSLEGALILARVRQDTTPLLRAADELARLVGSELSPKGAA